MVKLDREIFGTVGGLKVLDFVGTIMIAGFISQLVPKLKDHTGMTIVTTLVLGEFIHLLV